MLKTCRLYIGNSKIPNAGRGVFAEENIKKGELIEHCSLIVIPESNAEYLSKSFLVNYIFFYGKDKEKMGLALGHGSLYNHSTNPNICYEINSKEGTIDFIALKNIKKNVELTFDYSGGNNDKPLWFEF